MEKARWELLYDPTPFRALRRTRQSCCEVGARNYLWVPSLGHQSPQQLLSIKGAETSTSTVFPTPSQGRWIRSRYQKAMMIYLRGARASLNASSAALDVIDGMGLSGHDDLRSTKWVISQRTCVDQTPYVQPRASVIQQTLNHPEVPGVLSEGLYHEANHRHPGGWATRWDNNMYPEGYLFWHSRVDQGEVEIDSFLRLDVKWDVPESTLDFKYPIRRRQGLLCAETSNTCNLGKRPAQTHRPFLCYGP